jgi:hypothetical protein
MTLVPKRWLAVLLFVGLGTGLGATDVAPSSQRLTPEHFTKLHQLIKPTAHEDKWAQIPWMTSLWQARKRAAAEGKPILLWEMDGHPLGCT